MADRAAAKCLHRSGMLCRGFAGLLTGADFRTCAQEVAQSISMVRDAATETENASEEMLVAAGDLTAQSTTLQTVVGDFLARIRKSA